MIIKVGRNKLKNIIEEAILRSASWKPVFNGMEKIGFSQIMGANDYDGNPRWNIARFKIPKEEYTPEKEKQMRQLLNRCGWRIFRRSNEYYDFWGRGPFISVSIESERGDEVMADGIYYHATPTNRVNKILRNGLCPRDEGKRGEWRGPRVYLAGSNDRWLFRNLFSSDDYEVFKVDLTGSGIKLYKDEYADNGYYTLENIPPSRLELVDNPQRAVNKKVNEFFDMLSDALAGYGFNIGRRDKYAIGEVNGYKFKFTFNLFGGVTYTGGTYEIYMCRFGKKTYETRVGFHAPEDAVAWISQQINKAEKKAV